MRISFQRLLLWRLVLKYSANDIFPEFSKTLHLWWFKVAIYWYVFKDSTNDKFLRSFDLFCWRMDLHLLHSLSGDYLQFRSCFPPGYIPAEKINNNCFPSFPFQPEKINRSSLIKRRLYPQTAEGISPMTKCHQKSPSTIYIYSWYINSMRDMTYLFIQFVYKTFRVMVNCFEITSDISIKATSLNLGGV